MSQAVLDLRGMEIPDLLANIGENIKGLNEGEAVEFILDQEEVIPQLEKSDLKMEIRKVGPNYILKVFGGKIERQEEKEEEELEINENTNVGKLVSRYPEAIEILAKYGFTPIKNPLLRKTLAKTISLGRAKKLEGLSEEKFKQLLDELKELKERKNKQNK